MIAETSHNSQFFVESMQERTEGANSDWDCTDARHAACSISLESFAGKRLERDNLHYEMGQGVSLKPMGKR